MALELGAGPQRPLRLGDWTRHGRAEDLGPINDRAYTDGGDSFSRA